MRCALIAATGLSLTLTPTAATAQRAGQLIVAEPVVASRKADPVRVLMVFVDTLRPDHLSLYGYERDTTAAIDHLKTEAALFTHRGLSGPAILQASSYWRPGEPIAIESETSTRM